MSKKLGVTGPKSPNFGGKCIKKTVFSLFFGHLTPNVLTQLLELTSLKKNIFFKHFGIMFLKIR